MQDIASALTGSLARNGTGPMLADLDMNGFKIKNLGENSDPSGAARVDQSNIPVGTVLDFAGATAPEGFLLCYGQAVSRSTYSALFNAIGISWGSGDGTTTFNLPDFRGRVLAGKDNMGGTSADRLTAQSGGVDGDVLAATGGAETHTLATGQMPSHTHAGTVDSGGSHAHDIILPAIGAGGSDNPSQLSWNIRTQTNYGNRTHQTEAGGSHTHTFTTGSTGSGQAHNNVQPTAIINKIIRAVA